jgi:hypothetical protein
MNYFKVYSQSIYSILIINQLIINKLHTFFKNYLLQLLILLLGFNWGFAQENDLKNAEETQKYIANHIEKREFHLNELKFNANRFAIHEAEYFQRFEKYFYTIDRRNLSQPKALLMAVIIRIEKNRVNYHREYNFDQNGNLVYYTEQEIEAGNTPQNRLKVYFNQSKVLKWSEGDNHSMTDISDYSPNQVKILLDNAHKYHKKFEMQMSESANN